MLNRNIKVDLHIHSKTSEYKEADGYVDESNIENIDVLLSKLQENNINLISITDHNSFDSVFGGHPAPVDQTLHILFAGDIEMRFIIRGNIYMQKQHKTHKIQRAHFLHSGE